jgi:hypothetical protein
VILNHVGQKFLILKLLRLKIKGLEGLDGLNGLNGTEELSNSASYRLIDS